MAKKAVKGKKKTQKKAQPKNAQPRTGHAKKKRVQPAKVFIYALALAALGGGGFLVYDRLKRKKQAAANQIPSGSGAETIIINNSLPVSYSPTSTTRLLSSTSTRNDNFPLKRGSRGGRVTQLQQALAKTNPSIAIDGQFGPQTAGALKAAGYPEVVDQTLFNKITGGGSDTAMTVIFNPATLASTLYKAAQAKDFTGVLSALKQIKSVSEYSSVNDYYKKQSFISKTIVTDLLEYAFKYDESAKAQIKNEFLRMGLKVDSSGTWSLQGIRLYKDLITIRETVVTDSQGNKIPVRRNTILGDEIEVSNGMTWFKSIDNSILKVPTQDVKYT
ncbi:MAG: peptidoglycan-binding domain-containing protein [Bacteroidota bacterium]